jgi:DNA-binding IclR family transcriptional regulator
MDKRTQPRKTQEPAKRGAAAQPPAGDIDARYLVPALMRGMDILQTLSNDRRRRSLSEIASGLGVTRSSAYRLLYTLGHLGFVDYDAETKTYALGPQVLRLGYGYLASRDLVEVAMPHLVRLRDRTSWSAHLGELHGREVMYLARVATRRSIASTVHVGTRLPARATAMGRVLLSRLTDAEIRELYQDESAGTLGAGAVGAHGLGAGRKVLNIPALIKQAAVDRVNGAVVQNAVYEPGVASVAAPIYDVSGQIIAAVNISVVALFTTDEELNGPLKAEVIATAQAISHDLGREQRPDQAGSPPERGSGR